MTETNDSTYLWWAGRRMLYNVGLAASGIITYFLPLTICLTFADGPGDCEITILTPFHLLFQSFMLLVMLAIANVLYYLGPLSERMFKPRDVDRYRKVCFGLGFWFSVSLPPGFIILMTVLSQSVKG